MNRSHRFALAGLLACVSIASPVLAGPPLLVHPYTIGTERSLPWTAPQGRADYDRSHLIVDTDAILASSTSPLVHMETLRRAAIYARTDRALLSNMLLRFIHLAMLSEQSGQGRALAYLDAAYLIEAVRQIDLMNEMAFARVKGLADLSEGQDGYAWIAKAIALRPDDPAFHLAASLIALNRHQQESLHHAQLARAGAKSDHLLALNLDHLAH